MERGGKEIQLAVMEPAIDHEQNHVHDRREHDQQERDRHYQVNIIQADRAHQQISESALRGEHFAEHGSDQRQ